MTEARRGSTGRTTAEDAGAPRNKTLLLSSIILDGEKGEEGRIDDSDSDSSIRRSIGDGESKMWLVKREKERVVSFCIPVISRPE